MRAVSLAWLVCAQGGFGLGFLVCVRLVPGYVLGVDQGGVSNYGADRRTALPYTGAYLFCAGGTAALALTLPAALRHRVLVAGLLLALAGLLLLTLLTTYPYRRGVGWHHLHFTVAGLLVGYELAVAALLAALVRPSPVASVAVAAQAVGTLICLLSLRNVIRRLFLGQLLAGVAFAAALVLTLALTPRG